MYTYSFFIGVLIGLVSSSVPCLALIARKIIAAATIAINISVVPMRLVYHMLIINAYDF